MITTGQPADQFTVADPYKLVTVNQYATVPTTGQFQLSTPVGNSIEVSNVVSNQVTSVEVTILATTYTDFTVTVVNNNTILIECATAADAIAVTKITIAVGNQVMVQAEQIQFTDINMTTGVISNLRRGMNGTIVNATIDAGSIVQGIQAINQLPQSYYNNDWYGATIDTIPLQYTDTASANFLNTLV
jgi:hypothetical protein